MNYKQAVVLVIWVAILFSSGCIDRGSGVFRRAVESGENRTTEETNSIIQGDAKLKKLDDLCRRLATLNGGQLTRLSVSRERNALYFYYRLEADPISRLPEFRDRMTSDGWQVLAEEDGFWETAIFLGNDDRRIRIAAGDYGNANLSITCGYGDESVSLPTS